MESLLRLHSAGAIGGLLPSEVLELRQEQMGNSQHSAVYPGVLKMHHQEAQVWYTLTLSTCPRYQTLE